MRGIRQAVSSALVLGAVLASDSLAQASDAQLVDEINAARQKLDEAFQKHDAATLKAMMTSDHQSMTSYYGKDMTIAEQIETLDDFVFTFVNTGEQRVQLLDDGVAVTTFTTLYDGTFKGEPLPDKVLVTEIWVKQDGVWLQRLYQETPVPTN